jgi:pentatricopeptide repeat domain-containing protein 1
MLCCGKGRPQLAWRLLQRLAAAGDDGCQRRLLLAQPVYAEVVRALGKAGQWEACLEMVHSPWVPVDEACFAAAITACGREGRTAEALALWEAAQAQGHAKGPGCFEATARACVRAGDVGRARAVLQEAVKRGVSPSAAVYDAVLLGCGQRGESVLGAELLAEMRAAGASPSEISYGAVMAACVKTRDWRRSLALLKDMRERGVFPDAQCYAAALDVCALAGQWHRVPQLLDSMLAKGLEAPRALYLRLLGTLSRAGRWREAAETLERMGRQGLAPDDMEAHRLVLLACRRSGQWQKALAILGDLRRRGMRPSPACLEMALAACCRGGRWEEAERLFQELLGRRQGTRGAEKDGGEARNLLGAAYGQLLGLCGRTGRWQPALALVEGMAAVGLAPDPSAHLQGALLACKEADPPRWEEALGLLDRLNAATAEPATAAACYALALGACGKAGRWQAALDRLRGFLEPASSSSPFSSPSSTPEAAATAAVEEGCFEAVLEACARAGRWEEALALLREAQGVRRRAQLPVDADPYALAMWACVQGGQPERAVGLMAGMAGEWVAPNPRAHLTLLKALQQLGRVEESVTAFSAALAGPGALRLEVHLGKALATALRTCARAGRWREMLELLALTRRARGGGDGTFRADGGAGPPRSRPRQGASSPARQQHLPQEEQYGGVDVSAAAGKAVEVLLEGGRAQEAGAFLEALAQEAGVDLGASAACFNSPSSRAGDRCLTHSYIVLPVFPPPSTLPQ